MLVTAVAVQTVGRVECCMAMLRRYYEVKKQVVYVESCTELL